MTQARGIDVCKFGIIDSYRSVIYHQKLIDEWDKPDDDIMTRVAVVIRDIHKMYGSMLYTVLKQIEPDCKHPKKMQDVCNGMKYCMDCNLDLGKVKS